MKSAVIVSFLWLVAFAAIVASEVSGYDGDDEEVAKFLDSEEEEFQRAL